MKKFVLAVFLSMLGNMSFSKDITLKGPVGICSQTIALSGNDWRIASDSGNVGRQNGWFKLPPFSGSKQTPVPWAIQDIFHNYHGVVWYWREFETPKNLHRDGRYLLKFKAVDYLAEVWVNGKSLGGHEGSETPFDFDVTGVLNKGGKNLLVVRVLNPTYKPIDGIALKDTPSGAKQYPYAGNAAYNSGGIIGDVELMLVPAARLSDLFVVPDWKTGKVKIQTTILNTLSKEFSSTLSFKISEARNNSTRWLPLVNKGVIESMDHVAGYYRADRWAKSHPIFDGMPAGGMMDYRYFRNVISQNALSQEYSIVAKDGYSYDERSAALNYPAETVCGATRISNNYCSGLHVGVWDFGQGRFIVNKLHIGENLGKDPAADRLFCNMLNFASIDMAKPMTKLPEDFNRKLTEIGYQK